MVKRREALPVPKVDSAAAAAFAAGADALEESAAARTLVQAPALVQREVLSPAPDKLPESMLLRFRGEKVEAQQIAELALHYDRSKQYIAQLALQRGLAAMQAEVRNE